MNSRRKRTQMTCRWFLASVLMLGSAVHAYAADGGTGSVPGTSVLSSWSSPAIGEVSVNGGSTFEVRNLAMLAEQGGQTVTFTLTVTNNGSADLQFIDYWVRLRTKDGNQITVKVLPQDKDKNRIAPKSSKSIGFYAAVNESTKLQDLIFDIIQWDFNEPTFERKLGEVAVPAEYSMLAAAGDARSILIGGNPVKAQIKKVYIGKNEKNYTPRLVLNLTNTGSRSAALPVYQYLIRTSEGYMYPFSVKGAKELIIHPQTDKELELTGSVPISLSAEGWELIVIQYAADLKLNLPIAFFALPKSSEPDSAGTGKAYDFTIEEGTYTAELKSIQRLPWEDQDILAAQVVLGNKGEQSLPLPELTGYYMLDENVKVEAKLIRTDKVIGLPSGGSVPYQFIGKIPYTYEFGKAKLMLQEKVAGTGTGSEGGSGTGSGPAEDLLEFEHGSEWMNVPLNNRGESYKAESVGRSTSYKVRQLSAYLGDTADTIAVQLEAVNQEKRFNGVSRLVAYLKSADGTVFPAAVSEIKNKISPGGAALLFMTTTVPKGFDTNGMQLMIGDAVTQDKLTDGENKPDAYVNAVSFWLPTEKTEPKQHLKELDLAPYKLSIHKLYTRLDAQGVDLIFDYELTKELMVEANTEGRKLIISLEDEGGKITFSREFDFKDFDGKTADTGNPSEGTGKIKLGKQEKFKIEENDPELIYYLSYLKDYQVKVYDSFQGYKKLLASKTVTWFATMD